MNEKSRLETLQGLVVNQESDFRANPNQLSQDKLMETLKIYQAELELQNQQLQETQQALQTQKKHYQDLFQLQPVANIVLDKFGVMHDLNAAAIRLFSMVKNKPAATSLFRFLTPEAALWLQDKLTLRAAKAAQHFYATIELIIHRQRLTVCRANLTLLPESNQLNAFAILALEDISREHEIAAERTLFKTILDNSNALIFAVNNDFNLLVANNAFYRLHQLPQHYHGVVNVRDIFSAESMQRLNSLYDTVFVRGIPVTYEYEHSFDNKVHFFQTSAFPLKQADDEITGAGFITTDITDKMSAEIRLQTAMQIFSEGSEAVVIINEDFLATQVNSSFCHLLGKESRDLLGVNIFEHLQLSGEHYLGQLKNSLEQEGRWEGEVQAIASDTKPLTLWLRLSRVPRHGPFRNYLAIINDLTESKVKEAHITALAYFDSLTGLANRLQLRETIDGYLALPDKQQFSLLYLDLDHFKDINDIHGHDIGDALLKSVAERLVAFCRSTDVIARLGGDEFIIVFPGVSAGLAATKAQQLIELLSQPYEIHEQPLFITASIGVVAYPQDGTSYAELLQHADLAMYNAKQAGKAVHRTFSAELLDQVKQRYAMQQQLKQALENSEFSLVFQPIYHIGPKKTMVGCEALLRWTNPLFGKVSPEVFIPLLEESGQIVAVGEWVLQQSCAFIDSLKHINGVSLYCSVNVSAVQLWSEGFEAQFLSIINRYQLAKQIKLELTERVAMERPQEAAKIMQSLSKHGIGFSLDDFGTGYSSLAYLKYLPIETLKIDRSFVMDIGQDADDEVIIRALVSLAKSMNILTTAEGVETMEQLAFLAAIGCDHVQGYLLSKPVGQEKIREASSLQSVLID